MAGSISVSGSSGDLSGSVSISSGVGGPSTVYITETSGVVIGTTSASPTGVTGNIEVMSGTTTGHASSGDVRVGSGDAAGESAGDVLVLAGSSVSAAGASTSIRAGDSQQL